VGAAPLRSINPQRTYLQCTLVLSVVCGRQGLLTANWAGLSVQVVSSIVCACATCSIGIVDGLKGPRIEAIEVFVVLLAHLPLVTLGTTCHPRPIIRGAFNGRVPSLSQVVVYRCFGSRPVCFASVAYRQYTAVSYRALQFATACCNTRVLSPCLPKCHPIFGAHRFLI